MTSKVVAGLNPQTLYAVPLPWQATDWQWWIVVRPIDPFFLLKYWVLSENQNFFNSGILFFCTPEETGNLIREGLVLFSMCRLRERAVVYAQNHYNLASKKYFLSAYKIFKVKSEFFQVLLNLTFFSEQQTLSYTLNESLSFFLPSCCLQDFFFLDLTLYKEWQIASLKALWMQQYPDVPGACEHLDVDKHTIVRRLERVKWLDWTASVNPWGKSSVLWCVISWLSGEVCVGVCLCVSHMGSLPMPWVHWID